ncbi:phage tail sheath subtilisin-like domain-containing protein, partial [Nodularia spumigena CS-590/02]|uniref:phage tail sheath family protein n=1 Tax=Nodularia spumigena TaxID=70799 RepID=UPI00232AB614
APGISDPKSELKPVNNWGEFKNYFGDNIGDNNKNVLANAVFGFFYNGGTRCWVAHVTDLSKDFQKALDSFKAIDEISLVAVPLPFNLTTGETTENATGGDNIRKQINDAVLTHCEDMKDRFAIIDGLDVGGNLDPSIISPGRKSKYGAVYFPYLDVDGKGSYMPPSGYLAGVYARVDTERGIHKAPANEVIRGIQGVQVAIDKFQQGNLNDKKINVIRLFNGNVTVWGARTINENLEYINVRRTLIYLSESIDRGTQWAIFEPNTPALWQKIIRNVSDFLLVQWRSGALFGNTPQEAFYVKCDAETNPPELREQGQLNAEVAVSIVKPAEFVVFTISQTTLPSR